MTILLPRAIAFNWDTVGRWAGPDQGMTSSMLNNRLSKILISFYPHLDNTSTASMTIYVLWRHHCSMLTNNNDFKMSLARRGGVHLQPELSRSLWQEYHNTEVSLGNMVRTSSYTYISEDMFSGVDLPWSLNGKTAHASPFASLLNRKSLAPAIHSASPSSWWMSSASVFPIMAWKVILHPRVFCLRFTAACSPYKHLFPLSILSALV